MCRKLAYLLSFVLVLGFVSNASADLVGHWRFDEGSGTTAHDQSGNRNDGTLINDPVWAIGIINGALQFDGIDDYVNCGNDPSLNVNDAVTIAAWVKLNSVPPAFSVLIAGKYSAYWLEWRDNKALSLSMFINGAYNGSGPTLDLADGEWHHIALTYDGTQKKGYHNRQEVFSEGASGAIDVSGVNFLVGEGHPASASYNGCPDGLIDDVRVYNRALTQEEIQLMMRGKGYPLALGPVPKDGAIHENTWVNLGWRAGDFAVSHDVYLGDNFDDVNDGAESTFQGNQTSTFFVAGFPGFAYPDGLVPGTTYYWRIDEVNDTDPNSPWKGDVWSFMVPPKTAYDPGPANGAELVAPDVELSWTGGFGSVLHYMYFGENFDDVNNAAGGIPQGTTTYTPGPLKLSKTYYWRVDEFDAIETHKGDVWSFTTQGAVGSPEPSNGAVDVKQTQIITFSPGIFAASHQLYFGTDKDAVKNADTGSPEYKGTRDLGSQSYDPGKLEWETTYYWRVDEVNDANPDSPWIGPVWSFTTANFLLVDDFESYNDLDPAEPESNRIFNVWIDGYDNPTNGSLVGYDAPPFAEQTIVHGGNQSMPLYYDNSVGYSEATLTLTYPRDWTEEGVGVLSIWFRGNSDNAAETLYVALNGNAIVTNDNPDAAQITAWTQWTTDLQAFGVNLANVNTIALGLGNKNNPQAGGSGTMYFDDIRLYPPAP
ncbi:MAG TPA: LamG domain-containing protein [Sedimentisphaerales bacterium]|nr:LamG domain-containing protein [Sedimentisphaerales bacterium]